MDKKNSEKKIVTEMLDYLWRNASYSGEKAAFNIAYLMADRYINEKNRLNSIENSQELLDYRDPLFSLFDNREMDFFVNSSIPLDLKSEHASYIMNLFEDLKSGDTFDYVAIFNMLVNLGGLNKQSLLPSPIMKIIVELLVSQELPYEANIGFANCGNGLSLSEAINTLQANHSDDTHFSSINRNNTNIFGFDLSQENIILTKLQLLFNDAIAKLEQKDFLSLHNNLSFDLLFITPPFGLKYRDGEIDGLNYNLGTNTSSETAYLFKMIECLKVTGRGAIHLPEGFFFNQSYKKVREQLFHDVTIEGIISIPSGITKNSSVKTSVLIFKNSGHSYTNTYERKIWFYEINKNDLEYTDSDTFVLKNSQDLIDSWNTRNTDFEEWQRHLSTNDKLSYYPLSHRTNQNVTFASYQDIRDKQYNLSLNNYKFIKLEIEEEEKHDLKGLLSELIELEKDIMIQMYDLMDSFENAIIDDVINSSEFSPINTDESGENPIQDTETGSNIEFTDTLDPFTDVINQQIFERRNLLIKEKLEEIHNTLPWFIEQLADWQQMLLYRYYDPDIKYPLAIHEAAKGIVGVQEALQTTNLFKSMGLLEKVIYSDISQSNNGFDTPLFTISKDKPISIERWQPAIEFSRERKDENK
ncbi:N-6 DNA methylase [Bacillus toyonensis]|uniref:HsdM family class I SAM-dependent methyltransferase n=1 Tax=Bacillus toyonensis TaxID=155322 RepID=UPI000CD9E28B|nr:N-6 DNA methylase [Bacillus toyonensis]MED3541306.1 N-6 DNA methylase [Bacillus toyonensis]